MARRSRAAVLVPMVFVNRVQPDSEFVIVKARMWIIEHRDMVKKLDSGRRTGVGLSCCKRGTEVTHREEEQRERTAEGTT
jgi:hypothetical protein